MGRRGGPIGVVTQVASGRAVLTRFTRSTAVTRRLNCLLRLCAVRACIRVHVANCRRGLTCLRSGVRLSVASFRHGEKIAKCVLVIAFVVQVFLLSPSLILYKY